MNQYLEKVINSNIPENKGYQYIRTEDLFVPVLKVNLTIVKRRYIPLALLEEMILRIVECGISNIDEIAGVLGLERDIINITLADLHLRDLSYNTANNCSITIKGKETLKNLSISKRETDIIQDLYVNTGNDTITQQVSRNLVDYYSTIDHLLETNTKADTVDYYKKLIGDLQEIFAELNSSNYAEGQKNVDELLSIEGVNIKKVQYIRMPINIFVSKSGKEYDILPQLTVQRNAFNKVKDLIFLSIKQKILLKDIFINKSINEYPKPKGNFISSEDYIFQLKQLKHENKHHSEFEALIIQNRQLFENELDILFEYLLHWSKNICFFLDDIDWWVSNSKFMTLISIIPKKVTVNIMFSKCVNLEKVIKKIRRVRSDISKHTLLYNRHNDWFRIQFDCKCQIVGIPKSYLIEDIGLYLLANDYYLIVEEQ